MGFREMGQEGAQAVLQVGWCAFNPGREFQKADMWKRPLFNMPSVISGARPHHESHQMSVFMELTFVREIGTKQSADS